jgi:hypothetical protein
MRFEKVWVEQCRATKTIKRRFGAKSALDLCQLLAIPSRYELDGFLEHHGVPLEYSFGDFEREAATSARLWQKRQEDLAAERDR